MYLFQVRITNGRGNVRNTQFYAQDSVSALMRTIDVHKAHDKKVELMSLGQGLPQITVRLIGHRVRRFHTQEQADSYLSGYYGRKQADTDTEELGSFVGKGNLDAIFDREAEELSVNIPE